MALGGRKSDSGEAIFVDVRGFVYTTGSFEGEMDVDPDPDRTLMLYSQGEDDIFVVRYSNSGELRRAWSRAAARTRVGRASRSTARATSLSPAISWAGSTSTTTTPPMNTAVKATRISSSLHNDNALRVWSAVVGGRGEDERPAVAVDRSGNVYLTGTEVSANVKAKGTVYTLVSRGQEDFFPMLDSAGELRLG